MASTPPLTLASRQPPSPLMSTLVVLLGANAGLEIRSGENHLLNHAGGGATLTSLCEGRRAVGACLRYPRCPVDVQPLARLARVVATPSYLQKRGGVRRLFFIAWTCGGGRTWGATLLRSPVAIVMDESSSRPWKRSERSRHSSIIVDECLQSL